MSPATDVLGGQGESTHTTDMPGRAVRRRCMRSTLLITRSTWPTSPRGGVHGDSPGGDEQVLNWSAAALAARNWFMGDSKGMVKSGIHPKIRFSMYRTSLQGVSEMKSKLLQKISYRRLPTPTPAAVKARVFGLNG
jgi:hypothetical protein